MFTDFTNRSDAIEIMDDLNCSGDVINQTLVELEKINKWLGGNAVTLAGLASLKTNKNPTNLKIADLGCGGGDMLNLLASSFRKKGLKVTFTGIDANPNIIEFAKKNSAPFSEIDYQCLDILSEDFRSQRHDIIIATLFFHHFSTVQLTTILLSLKKQAGIGIIINDLHRHWLAYYSIKLLTKVFSKSPMIKFDAPLSVLRGFKRNELVELLKNASIKNYTLKWKWAFRWQVVIPCEE